MVGGFQIEKHPLHLRRKQMNEINSRHFICIVIVVEAKFRVFQLHVQLRNEYIEERQVGGSIQPTQVTTRKIEKHSPAVVPHCQQIVSAGERAVQKKKLDQNFYFTIFIHACMHAWKQFS